MGIYRENRQHLIEEYALASCIHPECFAWLDGELYDEGASLLQMVVRLGTDIIHFQASLTRSVSLFLNWETEWLRL